MLKCIKFKSAVSMRYKAYLVSVNSKKFSIRATHKNLPVLVFSASELWTGYDQAKAWLRCKKLPPDIDSGGVFCNDREGMVTFSHRDSEYFLINNIVTVTTFIVFFSFLPFRKEVCKNVTVIEQ